MKLAFITMQKNESRFLNAFVEHHASLSSYRDIFILDNGSTCEATITKLNELSAKGVNVIYQFNKRSDFENKGNVILEHIRKNDMTKKYDFVFPVDCDELLAIEIENKISLDKATVHKYLSELPRADYGYRIYHCLNNIPLKKDLFKKAAQKKSFFSNVEQLDGLDTGFHMFGKDEKLVPTTAVYLHFHNRYYQETLISARNKLSARVKDFSLASLNTHREKRKAGWHLIKYFMQNTNRYYAIKGNEGAGEVVTAELYDHLKSLDCTYPYLNKVEDDEVEIFWAKNPANITQLDSSYLDTLNISEDDKAILFSFGKEIDGFAPGNIKYDNENGFGWIEKCPKLTRDREFKDEMLGSFCLALQDGANYQVDVPEGLYRVRVFCYDVLFDNHEASISINGSEQLFSRTRKGEYLVYDLFSDAGFNGLNLEFSSKSSNFIVNAICIQPVNKLSENRVYFSPIKTFKSPSKFGGNDVFDIISRDVDSIEKDISSSTVDSKFVLNKNYLDTIKGIVDFYIEHQNEKGAIVDPYLSKEHQYASPAFAFACSICSEINSDYIKPAIDALFWSVERLVTRTTANRHEDFFPYLISKAFTKLKDHLSESEIELISSKLKSINPYNIYRSPIGGSDKSGQNWNMIASAGEYFLVDIFKKDDFGFIDNSLALQGRHFKGSQGVYAEGPVTYDIKPRVFWLDALLNGYNGEYVDKIRLLLKRGALTSLMIQSPDGSLIPGGRSGNHAWGDSLQCALFEMMSNLYADEGNTVLEQKYSSAASLALSSITRYIQRSGDLYTVKNRSDVKIRHGFESYSSCSHYNLLAAAMLSTAHLYSKSRKTHEKAICPPALSGSYFVDLSKELGRIVAVHNGTQIVLDTGRNHKQNPTGIIRVINANCGLGIYDGTLENASFEQPGNTATSSVSIGFEDSKGNLTYISKLSENKFKSVKVISNEITEEGLSFSIKYSTNSGVEITELVKIIDSAVTIRYISNSGHKLRTLQAPIMCSDGVNIIDVDKLSDNKIMSGILDENYFTVEFVGCSDVTENSTVINHRSGYVSLFEGASIGSDDIGFDFNFVGRKLTVR